MSKKHALLQPDIVILAPPTYAIPRPTHIDRLPGPQPLRHEPVTGRERTNSKSSPQRPRGLPPSYRVRFPTVRPCPPPNRVRFPTVSASRPSDRVRLPTVSASRPCPPPNRVRFPTVSASRPSDRVRLPTVSASQPCPPPNVLHGCSSKSLPGRISVADALLHTSRCTAPTTTTTHRSLDT